MVFADAAADALVQRLLPHFSEVTACEDSPEAAPAPLRALYRAGASWSLLPRAQSLGVFGFNVVEPSRLIETTEGIFGDAEERARWAARHGGADSSCAGPQWRAFALFSEFDALFVCLADGACRHVVSNCDEENDVPGGVPAVLAAVVDAVEARTAACGGGGGGGGDPAAQAALCRPLQRMRDAILSAARENPR